MWENILILLFTQTTQTLHGVTAGFSEKGEWKEKEQSWLISGCLVWILCKSLRECVLSLESLLLSLCNGKIQCFYKGPWWCFLLPQLHDKKSWSTNTPWWTLNDFQSRLLKSHFWKTHVLLAGYFPHFGQSVVLQFYSTGSKIYLHAKVTWGKISRGQSRCIRAGAAAPWSDGSCL